MKKEKIKYGGTSRLFDDSDRFPQRTYINLGCCSANINLNLLHKYLSVVVGIGFKSTIIILLYFPKISLVGI